MYNRRETTGRLYFKIVERFSMLYIINIRREKDNDTYFLRHFDDLIIRMSIA